MLKHIFACFDSPNVHSSIRIGIYGVMICPHIPIPVPCFKCQVRNLGMVKANVNLFVSIVQRKVMLKSLLKMIPNVTVVANLIWPAIFINSSQKQTWSTNSRHSFTTGLQRKLYSKYNPRSQHMPIVESLYITTSKTGHISIFLRLRCPS